MFKNPQSNIRGGNQIIFSEFLTSVDNGEVLKVDIQGNNSFLNYWSLQHV
jgi:cell division protease FtsH